VEDETPPTAHRERRDLCARFVPNIQEMFKEAAAAEKSLFFPKIFVVARKYF
jgi:hypothetical protein